MKYKYFEKTKISLLTSGLLALLYPFSCIGLMVLLFPLHSSMMANFTTQMFCYIGLGFLRHIIAICINRFYLSTYWLWLTGFCILARGLRMIDIYYGYYWTGWTDFLTRW